MGVVGGKQAVAWWDRWPSIEQDEIAAYERLAVPTRTLYRDNGVLILDADWPVEGQPPIKLEIRYSPFHPFVRPDVAAPESEFARHQHPIGKELCLLTQESHRWDSNQLVADFIQEQLARLFGALKAREDGRVEDAASLEEHSPDPRMPYFASICEPSSIIYFDGDMPLPADAFGLLDLTIAPRPDETNPDAVEAIVSRLRNPEGNPLGFQLKLKNDGAEAFQAKGLWLQMEPPKDLTFQALMNEVHARIEMQKRLRGQLVSRNIDRVMRSHLYVIGLVFPEEVSYGKTGPGWLFILARPKKGAKPGTYTGRYIRGERFGEKHLYARLPVAGSLRSKKALLIGCGAIGSFVALELARAGVGSIKLVDGDIALPGNSLRWALGRPAWGIGKARALANFIRENYPLTSVSEVDVKIGVPPSLQMIERKAELYGERLNNIMSTIDEADIIIDTAASSEIQHALTYFAREYGKTCIVANATFGAAGGLVARFRPGTKGCWVCLHESLNEGTIPRPTVDHSGEVTPVGCNEPTFTGGGFDLQEVSLEVVRSAIGILSGGAYDPGDWDVAVLDLRSEDGRRILPNWRHYMVEPHKSCCGAGS